MVKNHSDSERGNLLLPLQIFYMYCPTLQDSIYLGIYYTSCGALAGLRSIKRAKAGTHSNMTVCSTMELHLGPSLLGGLSERRNEMFYLTIHIFIYLFIYLFIYYFILFYFVYFVYFVYFIYFIYLLIN